MLPLRCWLFSWASTVSPCNCNTCNCNPDLNHLKSCNTLALIPVSRCSLVQDSIHVMWVTHWVRTPKEVTKQANDYTRFTFSHWTHAVVVTLNQRQ